jgi:hypothetical protein
VAESSAGQRARQWPSARKIWQFQIIVNRQVIAISNQNSLDRQHRPCRDFA